MIKVAEHIFRSDADALFEKSGNFTGKENKHNPFIILGDRDVLGGHVITQVHSSHDLTKYPDETLVLNQWDGQFRSDFFVFSIKQYKDYMQRKAGEAETDF